MPDLHTTDRSTPVATLATPPMDHGRIKHKPLSEPQLDKILGPRHSCVSVIPIKIDALVPSWAVL